MSHSLQGYAGEQYVHSLQATGFRVVHSMQECALLHLPGAGEVLSMRKCSLPCRSGGGVCRSV